MEDDAGLGELEKEYQDASASISRQISSLKTVDKSKISTVLLQIEDELSSTRQCLQEMNRTILRNDLTTQQKLQWRQRIERYQNDLKTLQSDFNREKTNSIRNDVFSSSAVAGGIGDGFANYGQTDDQVRLVNAADQHKKNTSELQISAKQLHDTEDVAIGIQDNLHDQRKTIERIRGNLGEGNTLLGRIGRTITSMTRRQAVMKILWCFIILVILGVIGIVIWINVKK